MMRNILVVGQSHIGAIRAASKTRREANPDAPRTRVIHTLEKQYQPDLVGEEGSLCFSEKLEATILDQLQRHRPMLASVIGGNFHNSLALIQHERPFDFYLSREKSPLPFTELAEPLPEQLVRAALEAGLARDFVCLRLLSRFGEFIHVESPPPVRSDRYITEQADTYFKNRGLTAFGVAPAGLRWRIWKLNSRIVREKVESLGCRFQPVPSHVCDAEGFLSPQFAGDATHGNEAYGEAIIQALETKA